jgi:periplasmic chaperone LolA
MKKPLSLVLVVCWAWSMLPGAALAAGQVKALDRFISGVHSLRADFSQVQRNDKGRVIKRQHGRVWLQRPGRFRWDYAKPYAQTIVSDGKTIYLYDPDLQQVTERPAKATLAGTPAALLAQGGALGDAFTVQDQGRSDGLDKVSLLPKSTDSDFQSIELWLADGVPQRMVFHDQLGDTTDIRFSDVQTNHRIDPSRFQFTPPQGVEVVKGAPGGPPG